MRLHFLLLLLACCPLFLHATVLDPPSLRCVSVGPGGEAILEWLPPADPTAEFQQYEVFHATSLAGPFSLVATLPTYALFSYTHVGAGADLAPQYYYLTTVSSSAAPNTSAPSDTLATIFVQVSQSVPLGSSVVDWNLPHDPPLPTVDPPVLVDMEYPLGTWTNVDTVGSSVRHWSQVVSICDDSLNFRVNQADISGCVSSSNAAGAVFQDITPPSVPVVVNVTVDTTTNQSTVNWEPSPEFDTNGYIIVLSTTGGNVILDTLYGRLNTSYTWPNSLAREEAESFTIAAIDTCLKGSPPSPNTSATHDPHTTIHLSTSYDRCQGVIRIQRTPYVGWPVYQYELFESVDGGPFTALATLQPDIAFYDRLNVDPDRTYCYVLQATGTTIGESSISNKACRTTAYPPIPQWNYIRTVTLAAPDQVLVTDSVDVNAFTRRLVLQRTNNGAPWEEIASLPGGIGPVVVFTDTDVLTAARSYTYRVLVEDSCGNTVVTSNIGNSILLEATPGLDGFNHLRWNGYVQWAGSVAGYSVYRSIADGPFVQVGTTPAGIWAFDDNVQDLAETPGKFCYYVTVNETGNPSGIDAASTSNVACAVQQEEVWIPNAFIAGGHNNSFMPVLVYADVDHYEFTIFNRWGQQIWTTNDRYRAWDGRVDGSYVPQGVYAYYCSFHNGAGKTVVRKGTVTFLPGR